jgi:hypothetical protein
VSRPPAFERESLIGRPINAKGQAVFTRQLATLVKAGMPIMRSLEVLARSRETRQVSFRVIDRRSKLPLGVGAPIHMGPSPSPLPFTSSFTMRKEGRATPVHAPCFLVGASALPTWSQSRS